MNKYILISVLVLAFFLRVVNIQNNPPALYGDELTIALDANSLLYTAKDQLGNVLPLTFAMGAGRPAGYVYGSIPFITIFGPNAVGVRMLSILSGVGIVFLLFLLCKKIFSEKVGLAAAIITAVSPWDINLSRAGFEAHFALFLGLLCVYFIILAKQRAQFYIWAAISFGLAIHTYPTYKLSLPLIAALFLWLNGWFKNTKSLKNKLYLSIAGFSLVFFAVLAAFQTLEGGSETRFSNINIFSQDKIKVKIEQKVNLERSISDLPANIAKYFHNKPIEYAKILIENYLQNFSVDFLVIHGDRNPRHNMATMGQIYLVEFILLLVGLLSFWQRNKRILLILLLWLILAPIPTAIVDLPHTLRSSFMLPPLIILSALGLVAALNQKNKLYLLILGLIFAFQFIFFIQKLYFLAPNEYSSFWSYPAKIASEQALQNKDKYKYIFLSDTIDSIEFAYPVYARVEPSQVLLQNKDSIMMGNYKFKKFGNVYIGHIPKADTNQFIDNLDGSVLFIGTPDTKNYLNDYETMESKEGLSILTIKKVYK